MYWMVRLRDQHGQFWMEADRKWSDSIEDGHKYDKEADARAAAEAAKTFAARSSDWFPRIKVVAFGGEAINADT